MKKLLLTLLLLFTLGLAAKATVQTYTVTAVSGGTDATFTLSPADGVSLTAKKNNGSTNPAFYAKGADARIYAKGTATVKCATDQIITKIVFNLSSQGKTRLPAITASTGTIATQAKGDATVTWTGEASEISFTVGDKSIYGSSTSKAGQFCFSTFEVTSESTGNPDDTRETAVLAWEPAELNLNLGDEFTAPTLSVKVNDVESADAKSAVAYTSSNPSLLSVAEDGTMTLAEGVTGTAEVTASIPSTNTSFKAEDAIFKVKVVDPNFTGYTALTDISELGGGAQGYILSKEKEAIMGAISGKYYDIIACAADCFTDGALTSVPENANKVTFVSDGTGKYYIKLTNGKYMRSTDAKTVSEVETTADATATSISVSEGNILIDFGTAGTLQYNASNPRFTTYTSKQTAVQAYIVTDASLADKPFIDIQHGTVAGKLIVKYSFTVKNHNGEEVKVNASVKGMDGVKFSEEQKTNAQALAPGESSVISGTLKATHESLKGNVAPTVVLTATANGKELFAASQAPNNTTGIEDVTVEGEGEAEYFNLQGLRVAQPEAGQLYIKRQGGKAVKVRF